MDHVEIQLARARLDPADFEPRRWRLGRQYSPKVCTLERPAAGSDLGVRQGG